MRDLLPALRAAGLPKFKEVGQREWIRRLRDSNPDPEANLTVKLVEFFTSKYDTEVTMRRNLDYVTSAAVELSPVLATVPDWSTELVEKFVDNFLKTSWATKCRGVVETH
ncbi:hypothetical protein A1O1_03532 [Capronia coronata CBS 617.96]|uniref:Uncharacterized protein n=1 Tax=Capronia coronata CBS 617.96 TaxID=1182541 RepID=W9YMI2_9EURO|nr:uncharacterized protein A1O1_03532 [Capronia coronata CBS 617.96]EXJ90431.1 hypothetical protein A1O1_03532 [Capronia coronata CBS 617.96]